METDRRHAHELLDQLASDQFAIVEQLLESMVEPLSSVLANAAVDDEEVTPETAAAIERGRSSLARGEGISHQDILREFGLSQ